MCLVLRFILGPVAQPGERCVRNAEAEGSNPFGSTKTEAPVSVHPTPVMLLFTQISILAQHSAKSNGILTRYGNSTA